MTIEQFLINNQWFIVILTGWSLLWKGLALWRSARLKSKPWFIAILLINSVGILEIIYLFIISKRKEKKWGLKKFLLTILPKKLVNN